MKADDRTTAIGLLNYAHAYWSSAVALQKSQLSGPHSQAPTEFLYYHAIELYLKSYLRSQDFSVKQITNVGHDVRKLGALLESKGLDLLEDDKAVLGLIPRNYLSSRYIITGSFIKPTFDALWQTCNSLHVSIEYRFQELKIAKRTLEVPQLPEEG